MVEFDMTSKCAGPAWRTLRECVIMEREDIQPNTNPHKPAAARMLYLTRTIDAVVLQITKHENQWATRNIRFWQFRKISSLLRHPLLTRKSNLKRCELKRWRLR
eukprot:7703107-Pyramimonas_sp.AAC.1